MRLTIALLALLAAASLAACTTDGGGPRTMKVVGTEMAFTAPDQVEAGAYEVTFRNAGAEHHELAFRNPGGEFVARRSIAGGEEAVIEVELTPGEWELGCFEPGHYEAGMYRPLTVVDD